MNMSNFSDLSLFSLQEVKQLFFCLDDIDSCPKTSEQCCCFINKTSEELSDKIFHVESNKKPDPESPGESKKIKISRTFLTEEVGPDPGDEFEYILSELSNHIKELQRDFKIIPVSCGSNDKFFVKFNLIQYELVKIKSFLSLKPSSQFKSKCQKKLSTFQVYNLNINRILNNRLLIVQLLHLECIILDFLKSVGSEFSKQSNLFKDVIINQLQEFFKSYYILLIKLSYEPPFSRMIKLLHPKSAKITPKILFLLFKIINTSIKKDSEHHEMFDSIINNRSIVIILDYIIMLGKIGTLSFEENFFKKNELIGNFDAMGEVVQDFINNNNDDLSPQISLVKVASSLLACFFSMKEFIEKSLLRTRTLMVISLVCRKLQHAWDIFASALLLISTLIDLLESLNDYHVNICKETLLNLEKDDIVQLKRDGKMIEKGIRLKYYMAILRDIFGILSILLTFTERSISFNYLRHLDLTKNFFSKFIKPFVYWLNGNETSDPDISKTALNHPKFANLSDIYSTLCIYRNQYERIIFYSNRIVIMSSILVQRLLPPLTFPLENHQNPFRFSFSEDFRNDCHSSENDIELDDDELCNSLGSDEEDTESDLSSETELNESFSNESSSDSKSDLSFLRSYLCFFPETKLFQDECSTTDKDETNKPLRCLCDVSSDESCKENAKSYDTNNTVIDEKDFDWQKTFSQEYNSTRSVTPKQFIPKPELNCLLKITNNSIQQLSYPFLENAIRYKNFSQIKLVDHIEERLSDENDNLKYELIYDVEKDLSCGNGNDLLKFESRFECGNLRKAFAILPKIKAEEENYILLLNTDINSSSHTQWFYFSVQRMRRDKRYRFKIINCEKKSILFNWGQQPLFYSCKEFEKSSKTWQRLDKNGSSSRNLVAYFRNHYVKKEKISFKGRIYYTLEFTFMFPHEHDECYFAFNIPFSYTLLKTCISRWSFLTKELDEIFFSTQTLCSTLKGNDLPLITITSNRPIKKHYVLITARVHPAESNSSWMLKGFIDYLVDPLNDSQSRRKLLDNYIFKIIPMLNPDGVINGCTRTDLQAEDLNRHWSDPSLVLHPTIYHAKMILECLYTFSDGQNPVALIDMHGHSRCQNIFSYSCFPMLSSKKTDRQMFQKKVLNNHQCVCPNKNGQCQFKKQIDSSRFLGKDQNDSFVVPPFAILPLVLHYQKAPAFQIENCSFDIQGEREQTARIVAWRQFGIDLSYTIECSANGCVKGQYAGQNLSRSELEEMGHYLATSFNFIHFIFCSQKHSPIIVWPKNSETSSSENNDRNPIIDILMEKCAKSKNLNQPLKRERIKKMILKLYPDLLGIDSYFQD